MVLLFLSFNGLFGSAVSTSFLNTNIMNESIVNARVTDPNLVNIEKMNYWVSTLSNDNYLMRSFQYKGDSPPWYVPYAEFCGGVVGSLVGASLGTLTSLFSYYILYGNPTESEWGMPYLLLYGMSPVLPSAIVFSVIGISITGNKLGHKGSICGALLCSIVPFFLSPYFGFDFYDAEGLGDILKVYLYHILTIPLSGTIGYQFFSTYNRR